MSGRTSALVTLALFVAMGFAAPAYPQDVSAPCRLCDSATAENEKPATPVSLDVEASLDFDRLILAGTGEGSAELAPDGGRAVTGSITAIGARAMVGEVVIRGEPGRIVRVALPDRIDLFGLAGGSIRLESIRSDLPAMPRLDGEGRLSFRFGGILRVSGDLDGEFRGDIPIDVEYF
ncbi:MAG: DUF4402 domain-containing protein [Sphingomicrobium sp.]